MEFLFELLVEIVGEILSAVLDFCIFKVKKHMQKQSDVIIRSIMRRQAIKKTHNKGNIQ